MKNIISITIAFVALVCIKAQNIAGQWSGNVNIQGTSLSLVFNIKGSNGTYTTTWDSPNQGVTDIPANATTFENKKLRIESKAAGLVYEGVLKNEDTIEGALSQAGMNLPLVLTKSKMAKKADKADLRPQEPKPPFSYQQKDVVFSNKKENVNLAGTITYPNGKGPFPAVVLVSGSGPQNRNSEIFGHKPFWVLADYLTKRGIAVLRYDDRGTGESTGNFSTATSKNFANDAEAAFEFLQSEKNIDPNKVGILGHSEGGLIAPIVAARNAKVAFIGLLAGPGVAGSPLILEQQNLIEKSAGVPESQRKESFNTGKELHSIILTQTNADTIKAQLRNYYEKLWASSSDQDFGPGKTKEQMIKQQVSTLSAPWFMNFLRYDPAPALQKVTCPVLAINGSNDLQVSPQQNLPAIKAALEKANNKNATFVELQGLNHLFQESETGSPNDYGKIKQTFAPVALETIGNWVIKVTE